jgi:hypothetical protein
MILSVSSPSIEELRKVTRSFTGMPWEFNGPKCVMGENEAVVSSKTLVSTPFSRPGRVFGVSIIGE